MDLFDIAVASKLAGGGGSEHVIINIHFPQYPGDVYSFDKTREEVLAISPDCIYFRDDTSGRVMKPISILGHRGADTSSQAGINFYIIDELSVPVGGVNVYSISFMIITCNPNDWSVDRGFIYQQAE